MYIFCFITCNMNNNCSFLYFQLISYRSAWWLLGSAWNCLLAQKMLRWPCFSVIQGGVAQSISSQTLGVSWCDLLEHLTVRDILWNKSGNIFFQLLCSKALQCKLFTHYLPSENYCVKVEIVELMTLIFNQATK